MTRVLITRPAHDARILAEECRAGGLEPVCAPVMEIENRTVDVDTHDAGALAFTSANGVRAFAVNCTRRDIAAFAVGPATAQAAYEAGFSRVTVCNGNVQSLAQTVTDMKHTFSGTVLHIRARTVAGNLSGKLHDAGIPARGCILYEARAVPVLPRPARAALDDPRHLWAVFFSPRTVKLFLELVLKAGLTEKLARVHAVCTGDTVAGAAAGAVWADMHVSPCHTFSRIVNIIRTNMCHNSFQD